MGGGDAGRAAARAAAEAGRAVTLVDEDALAPDLTEANVPFWYGGLRAPRARGGDPRLADLSALAEDGVSVLPGVRVWGVFPGPVVALHDETRSWLERPGRVVLATGSCDLALPFRGWRLAGVFGGGAALVMLERTGTLGGARRVAVVGAGTLANAVASAAARVGVRVVAVMDGTTHGLERVEGASSARAVTMRALDSGARTTIEVDGVCVAVGLQPAIELADIAGCALVSRPAGGRAVVHDIDGRTTVEGVFVAGRVAAPDDATALHTPWLEDSGRRTALAALGLGTAPQPDDVPATSAPSYTTWLDATPCPDDEAICACEGVEKRVFVAALRESGGDIDEAKRRTRLGMGPCQGRRCLPVAHDLAPASTVPRSRPPARAVPLRVLATEEEVVIPRLGAFERAAGRLAADIDAGRLSPFLLARFRRRADEYQYRCVREGRSDAEVERLAGELEMQLRLAARVHA